MSVELLTPILEHGIRNINYFHGRLLSARDLREQQESDRLHRRHLGRAIGAGVVEGLTMSVKDGGADGASPVLTVEPGLAIDGEGKSLVLPEAVDVQLTRELTVAFTDACVFRDCRPPRTGEVATGVGLYVFIMSPASGYAERAPMSGLETGTVNGCGNRYAVEGVRFRLEKLDVTELASVPTATRTLLADELLGATDAPTVSRLRNLAAHLVYGTQALPRHVVDPFPPASGESPYLRYGALDDLRDLDRLTPCDVPLGLLYWTLDGIGFLDLWSVRRRPHVLHPAPAWPLLPGERRRVEAEAMVLQFQAQLADVLDAATSPGSLRADEYFHYLPPAGLLPADVADRPNVEVETFLAPVPYRRSRTYLQPARDGDPQYLDGHALADLLERALAHAPVDLAEPEMVWLYRLASVDPDGAAPRVRAPYLVFASRHVPPANTARFDVARWNFANYARRPTGGFRHLEEE